MEIAAANGAGDDSLRMKVSEQREPDVFTDIRESTASVVSEFRSVRIESGAIPRLAELLLSVADESPGLDPEIHFRGDPGDTVHYVFALDAINFGSGWFPDLGKGGASSGYETVASNLAGHYRRKGPPLLDGSRSSTGEDVARLLKLEGRAAVPLARHYATAWNQLGQWLGESSCNSFLEVVASVSGSASALIGKLRTMPAFDDVAIWRGKRVPFLKRAQILCSDLALALAGDPLVQFEDLHRLTAFADNLLPVVLLEEKVLAYDDALERRLRDDPALPSGSPEEVGIRAATIQAVEQLSATLIAGGRKDAFPHKVDEWLWNLGRDRRYRKHPLRHRTRTLFY